MAHTPCDGGIMNGLNLRRVAPILVVFFAMAGAVAVINHSPVEDKPSVASAGILLTTDMPYMRYCESPGNRPITWYAQREFLVSRQIIVANNAPGQTLLDYTFEGGQYSITVRYFAGRESLAPCMFGLVQTANHPEWDAATHRFVRSGEPTQPPSGQFCVSYMPPLIQFDGQSDTYVAVLRCDKTVN